LTLVCYDYGEIDVMGSGGLEGKRKNFGGNGDEKGAVG